MASVTQGTDLTPTVTLSTTRLRGTPGLGDISEVIPGRMRAGRDGSKQQLNHPEASVRLLLRVRWWVY